jgi:hypothetical protein
MIMVSCHRRSPFCLLYIRPGPRAQPQHHSSPHVLTFAKRRQFPLIGELTTGRVTDGNTNGCSNIMNLPWRITCIQPVGSLPAVARHTYLLANLQGMVVSGRQGDKCHWRSEANGVLTLNQRANDIYGRPKNILVRRRVRGLSWGITGPQYRRSPPHQKVSPPPPPRPAWAVPQSKKNRTEARQGPGGSLTIFAVSAGFAASSLLSRRHTSAGSPRYRLCFCLLPLNQLRPSIIPFSPLTAEPVQGVVAYNTDHSSHHSVTPSTPPITPLPQQYTQPPSDRRESTRAPSKPKLTQVLYSLSGKPGPLAPRETAQSNHTTNDTQVHLGLRACRWWFSHSTRCRCVCVRSSGIVRAEQG